MNKFRFLLLVSIILILSGCAEINDDVEQPYQLETIPVQILISEVFTGVEGNNQADFVELYNLGTSIADLQGFSLWYQLNEGVDEILLYHWNESTLIPPLGYYALIMEGQLFTVLPDAHITQPLVPSRGGLSLRLGEKIEDQMSWGTGPTTMTEGNPAVQMISGSSLSRSAESLNIGNGDTNDNFSDFQLNANPGLQNTGSLVNQELASGLDLIINFPHLVKPGEHFEAGYKITNQTGRDLADLEIFFPLPEHISLQENAEGYHLEGELVSRKIPNLRDGETFQDGIPLQGAFTFSYYSLQNIFAVTDDWPLPAFAGPFYGEIGGGAIPINTARDLIDQEVVVEGISTMYVGGFFAGTGAKFYVEDNSGGIQVYVSGAGSSLIVPLGSTVRVRGKITLYRDSLELIPSSEDQVEILQGGSKDSQKAPENITIKDVNTRAEILPGKLIEVEGLVARIEEFSYSYEIDLFDENGNLVSLYIDKETGISIEEIEADQYYRVSGIMELLDGNLRLYPRLQSDLSRVYPPGLTIQTQPPTTASSGDPFTVIYSVINHGSETDQNLLIQAPIDPALEILDIQNNGRLENNSIIWEIPALAGGGEKLNLEFQAKIQGNPEYVSFNQYSLQSDLFPDPVGGLPSYTFSGESVPIWAIQGAGERSPYILAKLTTEGVVTGVFPAMEGFWIQEKGSDNNPATSPGIFISTGINIPDILPGDFVSVTGQVREAFQQTQLDITSAANVVVLGKESLPAPVTLAPPPDFEASRAYYEALEGSLVSVPGSALVVGPSTRYGEFALVLATHGITRTWQEVDHGMLIYVDDGSTEIHDYADTLPSVVAVGDTVSNLTGTLSYSFGNYKIEPIKTYNVQNQEPVIVSLPMLEEGYFRLMSWNVENLFDFVVPHPSSPPLPKVSEYKRDISKVAQTIQAAGYPTVIGLQEVEDIGVLEDITSDPLLIDYLYQAVLIEGTDSRGIDVGYLVRGDQAAIINQVQYPAPGNITSRPPLLIEIQIGEGNSPSLIILNNHFTSMSGGEKATEPRRNAQADWNVQIALELLAENPDNYLAVMGDLNSYYNSLPLQTLEAAGLINVFDQLEPEERYTYVYQGISQVLDHILMNYALEGLLVQVEVLHVNADFPLPYSSDLDILHKSDHDPVLATFILP